MATNKNEQKSVISSKIEFGYRGEFFPNATAEGADCGALTLTFIDGRELLLTTNRLSSGMLIHAALHGLKQKLIDAAAISRNPENGRAATPEDKYNAVRAVYERLLTGQWNATREGGGNGSGGLLFRALVRLYPAKTPEALATYLATKTDAEKTALRKNPKVAAMIETIRAETGRAANIDTDELLGELEG